MREGREERKPRPGRGTPIGDTLYRVSRTYSDYCAALEARNTAEADILKGLLKAQAEGVTAQINAL